MHVEERERGGGGEVAMIVQKLATTEIHQLPQEMFLMKTTRLQMYFHVLLNLD